MSAYLISLLGCLAVIHFTRIIPAVTVCFVVVALVGLSLVAPCVGPLACGPPPPPRACGSFPPALLLLAPFFQCFFLFLCSS
jgi:hypothetical protein